jgi:hypothetical protein
MLRNVFDQVYKENEGRVPYNAIVLDNRTYIGYKCLLHDIQVTRDKPTKQYTDTLSHLRHNITDMCFKRKFAINSNSEINVRALTRKRSSSIKYGGE